MNERVRADAGAEAPLLIPDQVQHVSQNEQQAHLPDGTAAQIPAQVIKAPTKEEIERIQSGRTCGNCDCYEYDAGQEEMRRQRFFERMVKDENWKREWLENPNAMSLDQFGMCGQSDDMAVPAMSAACPEWRPRRKGLVRSMLGKVKQRFDPILGKDED
jgi:hypothetical protein